VFKGLRLAKMTFLTKLSYFKLSIHQIILKNERFVRVCTK